MIFADFLEALNAYLGLCGRTPVNCDILGHIFIRCLEMGILVGSSSTTTGEGT